MMHDSWKMISSAAAGPRSPVLLLHTLGASAATWAPLLAEPSGDRRVAAIDLPGHGARAEEAFTVDAALSDAAHAMDAIGPGPVHVVGSGLGSCIALRLATRYPDEVRSVVVASFAPTEAEAADTRMAATSRALQETTMAAFGADYLAATLLSKDPLVAPAMSTALQDIRPESFLSALRAALLWSPDEEDIWPMPVLLARGEGDRGVTASRALAFGHRIGARYVELNDVGHLAYLEDPRGFWGVVSAFISHVEASCAL